MIHHCNCFSTFERCNSIWKFPQAILLDHSPDKFNKVIHIACGTLLYQFAISGLALFRSVKYKMALNNIHIKRAENPVTPKTSKFSLIMSSNVVNAFVYFSNLKIRKIQKYLAILLANEFPVGDRDFDPENNTSIQ